MPEEGVKFQPREEILTFEEIERFVRVAVSLGVRKLRLTGGLSLCCGRILAKLIRRLECDRRHSGHGADYQCRCCWRDQAQELYDAGLQRRLNIHLDGRSTASVSSKSRGATISGKVMDGIEARRCAFGYPVIKINAVAVKNLVEADIVPLARFGRENGIEIRYIEFMPLDAQGIWDHDKVLLTDDMIAMLTREIGPLREIPDRDPRAPATEYEFADGKGRIGFIASVSKPRSA